MDCEICNHTFCGPGGMRFAGWECRFGLKQSRRGIARRKGVDQALGDLVGGRGFNFPNGRAFARPFRLRWCDILGVIVAI